MNKSNLTEFPKYNINKYVNTITRAEIESTLNISQPTFWRKSNIKINEAGGFEICQLKQIADILDRNIFDLLTTEAKEFYGFK